MTLSTFRSRWSWGTNPSTSTITMSFRESFFQFSIFNPPFLYYTRRTPPLVRFFDRLKNALNLTFRAFWCGHGDSNPNAVKHENLNLACLPISSCPHSNAILPQPRAGSKQKIAVRFLKAAETRKRCIFYFVLRLHNERETHGANPVSPAFLIRFRRAAAPPSGAAFFRRTSASRCRTRRG